MTKRLWMTIAFALVLAGLYLVPVYTVTAQEETPAAETTTEEEGNVDGPGTVILLLGLVAIGFVSFTYMARPQPKVQDN